ncbi:hypothetical protein ZWY2020_055912 [Hordeum vulgare]|nr:hypothetical protein ZWY2020_055912 [Hordeum vulgare]
MKELDPPCVIAAHGRSILFQIYVPFIDQCYLGYYPIDYFVYTASGSPCKRPYLRRLPPCFKGGSVDPELDNLFHPYRYQQQRPMSSNDIGLLCHDDEEFTVAKLSPWGEICLLHYAPDKAMEWDIRRLEMPRGEGIPSLLSRSWNTDVVIPFGDSLCWVDCYLGLLFLIAISDLAGRSLATYSSNFKIRTWKLISGVKWKEDATMEDRDLKDVLAFDKRVALLPLPPEFPTINLVDHDIVCFVLNNGNRICWLVEVNLKKKAVGVVTLYINEEKEGQAAAATAAEVEKLATVYDIVCKTTTPSPLATPTLSPASSPCT